MKKKSKLDRPVEHLGSVAADGSRIVLYPEIIAGIWRKRRTVVQTVLVLILLIMPWLKIGGTQAILLDVIDRKFSIFGMTFWAHDGPLVFFLIAVTTLSLAFITAIWGRAWCGWACPQTVFIEGIFRKIELWVEGNHRQRQALDQEELNLKKLIKKTVKWSLFFAVCSITAHSLLAYFVGSDRLVQMIQAGPSENMTLFFLIFILTGALLFDFALFREQFCILVCPYGRIQSVLLDKNSLAVTYDVGRGEPRKGSSQINETQPQGDCINCYKCVTVCPTGIDIRRGLQMECIQCTACIDACDSIMDKVEKPRGLIRYSTENEQQGRPRKIFTLRSNVYLALIALSASGFIYSVSGRENFHIAILRGQETPYKEISNEPDKLINHFKIHIKNQKLTPNELSIDIPAESKASGLQLIFPMNPVVLKPGEIKRIHFFVKTPKALIQNGQFKSSLVFSEKETSHSFKKPITLLGPR